MDKHRKKILAEQYKQMKPEMGIFVIKSAAGKKCLLQTSQNLKSFINSTKAKLDNGMHPNRGLQTDWDNLGSGNFTIDIIEKLQYDKDENKTDYSEELALLRMICEEKLLKENMTFYS